MFLVGALVAYLVLLFSPGLLNINPHLLLIIAAGDALVILLRAQMLKRLLNTGTEVPGKVEMLIKAGAGSAASIVKYNYAYNGQTHTATYNKNKGLKEGQNITVILDPNKPQRSTIKEIFTG